MRFEVDEFFADAGVHLHTICEEKLSPLHKIC